MALGLGQVGPTFGRPRFRQSGSPPSIGGGIGQDILAARGAGFFDPRGSPLLRALLQRRAIASGRGRRRSVEVLGRLAGLDPMQQRQSLVDIGRETSGDISDLLNQSELQQLMGNVEFARGLLGGERRFEQERQLAREQAERERRARGGFGSQFGSLLGMGAGAFLGGPGGAVLGKKLFGG